MLKQLITLTWLIFFWLKDANIVFSDQVYCLLYWLLLCWSDYKIILSIGLQKAAFSQLFFHLLNLFIDSFSFIYLFIDMFMSEWVLKILWIVSKQSNLFYAEFVLYKFDCFFTLIFLCLHACVGVSICVCVCAYFY